MYYDSSSLSKEELLAEEKRQYDVEVYINLKQSLQTQLFNIILNWDLFSPVYDECLALINK